MPSKQWTSVDVSPTSVQCQLNVDADNADTDIRRPRLFTGWLFFLLRVKLKFNNSWTLYTLVSAYNWYEDVKYYY